MMSSFLGRFLWSGSQGWSGDYIWPQGYHWKSLFQISISSVILQPRIGAHSGLSSASGLWSELESSTSSTRRSSYPSRELSGPFRIKEGLSGSYHLRHSTAICLFKEVGMNLCLQSQPGDTGSLELASFSSLLKFPSLSWVLSLSLRTASVGPIKS